MSKILAETCKLDLGNTALECRSEEKGEGWGGSRAGPFLGEQGESY